MPKYLKIVAGALSGFFVVTGLLWLVVPDFVARQMRMELLTGDGLTTQIGDLAAFFLTLGGSIAIALITMRSVWLYPPVMLLSFAAAGRLIAWSVHGAGLTLDMIVFEIVAAALLVFTAERMPEAGR